MNDTDTRPQVNLLFAQASDAISHWDAPLAWRMYREIQLLRKGSQYQKQQVATQKIYDLERQLLVVAFPAEPSEVAQSMFRSHFLDFFRVDVDLAERLRTRYVFVGYGEKEEERLRLLAAIRENSEQLGGKSIAEWLRLFDQRYKLEERTKKTAREFVTGSSEAANLSKSESAVLTKILSVYDELLCREYIDEFDLAFSETASRQGNGGEASQAKGLINTPLLKALAEYPQLGQQTITSGRIKLKGQPEPQRGSLNNWIRAYRDELGVGFHDEVQRGHFLFQSVNGRQLSPEDRERINLILKSIEENIPLDIDSVRQIILFPPPSGLMGGGESKIGNARIQATPGPTPRHSTAFISPEEGGVTGIAPLRSFAPPTSLRRDSFAPPAPTPNFLNARSGDPAKNIAEETLHFSTGHVLPAEHREPASPPPPPLPARPAVAPPVRPTTPQTVRNPYSIRPLRMRQEENDDDQA